MSLHLDHARILVLEWLRAEHRDPSFLSTEADADSSLRHDEIAQRFMTWARKAGFEYQTVKTELHGDTAFEVHWTHRGASFVGFKQPPPESTSEDALLAGCAALLENQWCRTWLTK